jgi:hypothetical protein
LTNHRSTQCLATNPRRNRKAVQPLNVFRQFWTGQSAFGNDGC